MIYILVKEKLDFLCGRRPKNLPICPMQKYSTQAKNVGIDPDEDKKHIKPSGALELCGFIISYWSIYLISCVKVTV